MTFMTPMGFFGVGLTQAAAIHLNGSSQRLDRTAAATSTTRTKYTWSFWVRPSITGTSRPIWTVDNAAVGDLIYLGSDNLLRLDSTGISPGDTINAQGSTAIAPNVWTHLVLQYDSTLSNAPDRIRMWINGVSDAVQYSGGNTPGPSQNLTFAINTLVHSIGYHQNSGAYWSGDLALMHWIDGAIVAPSTFAATVDGDYIALTPTGLTYQSNGGYYRFENPAALGADTDNSKTYTAVGSPTSIGDGPPLYVAP